MNEPSYEFFRHALVKGVGGWSGCGGGGGAGLAAFLAACAFFDVVVDVPVVQVVDVGLCSSWTRLSCPLLCKTGVWSSSAARGVLQLQFLDQVVTCQLLRRQVQFLDTVETPVVVQRQVLGFRQCRNLWNFRSCSADKVVDVPVYAVHRRLWTSL